MNGEKNTSETSTLETEIAEILKDLTSCSFSVLLECLHKMEEYSDSYKDELGEAGVIPALVAVLSRKDKIKMDQKCKLELEHNIVFHLRMLSIANAKNKKKSACAVIPVLELAKQFLATNCLESLLLATMALWCFCYGTPENTKIVLSKDGILTLVQILGSTDPEVRYAAAGAIWHTTELTEACQKVHEYGGIPLLVEEVKQNKTSLTACLALSNISIYQPDLVNDEILQCIDDFLEDKDPLKFENKFVWTTVHPIVALLECNHSSVVLLGTFLAVVTIKSKEATASLFMEGAIKQLKDIALISPKNSLISKWAHLALHEIGISLETNSGPPLNKEKDLESWLKTLKIHDYLPTFKKHGITLDTISYITETDLEKMNIPIGTRRKLLHVISGMQKVAAPVSSSNSEDCLVCFAGPKEMCFVPCGHVVTCERCAGYLNAKGDRCIICRSPIRDLVKPFFV